MLQDEENLEFTADLLAARITAVRREATAGSSEAGGIIFLLGAGCSRQYGLPRFRDVLEAMWTDFYRTRPSSTWPIEYLRESLDRHWMALGPRGRREMMKHYVRYGQIQGQHCPGYRRLAQMAKLGGIRAFVNLNFDTLLEEALKAEDVSFLISSSFRQPYTGSLVVYKPHGLTELPEDTNDSSTSGGLILDIAQSDLFADPSEQRMARDLFGQSDVVAIGYSGADARIAAALSLEETPSPRKLFIINRASVDPRLAFVAAERASAHLVARTDFESFMERLYRLLSAEPRAPRHLLSSAEEVVWTLEERVALKICLRLAYGLQAISGVNDLGSEGIEAHGERVFCRAMELANSCGLILTGPEKFLLQAAGYLHDAACFSACGAFNDGPRLEIWHHHGRLTAERISDQLRRMPQLREQVIPSTYERQHRELILEGLLRLCSHHSSIGQADNKHQDGMIRVNGIELPLRFSILPPLLALADQIESDHPFLPWSDPILRAGMPLGFLERESPYIHLKRSGNLQFEILVKRLHVRKVNPELTPSARDLWQIGIASLYLQDLNAMSLLNGGWGIEMACDEVGEVPVKTQLLETLTAALQEPVNCDAPDTKLSLTDYVPPKAFISYSWDSNEHCDWVKNLATRLRFDGIDVKLDAWDLPPGAHLTAFMEWAIWEADYVLIVCTPNYRVRSDGNIGGAGREGSIMTPQLYRPEKSGKFIPLLRGGEAERAVPRWLYDIIYIDLRDSHSDDQGYTKLLNVLLGRLPKAPIVGMPPRVLP